MIEPLNAEDRWSAIIAVCAHLLEMAGDHGAALDSYRKAARLTTSIPEQNYQRSYAARLADKGR